jgi:DNA-directed RNA polymerase subunit RPC12/RpoP
MASYVCKKCKEQINIPQASQRPVRLSQDQERQETEPVVVDCPHCGYRNVFEVPTE